MAAQKFEEAMKRLEEIVQSLEEGELSLEEALTIFEEGMKLVKFSSRKLDEAEKRVTVLIQEKGGKFTEAPFGTEEEKNGE